MFAARLEKVYVWLVSTFQNCYVRRPLSRVSFRGVDTSTPSIWERERERDVNGMGVKSLEKYSPPTILAFSSREIEAVFCVCVVVGGSCKRGVRKGKVERVFPVEIIDDTSIKCIWRQPLHLCLSRKRSWQTAFRVRIDRCRLESPLVVLLAWLSRVACTSNRHETVFT